MHLRSILRLACSSHATINVKRLILILELEHNLDDNLHADRLFIFIFLILFLVSVVDGFFPKLIFSKKKKNFFFWGGRGGTYCLSGQSRP